jgi:hypothetical protein
MTKTVRGRVRGKMIELDEELGLTEGQAVVITVQTAPVSEPWGEGLRRCAGAFATEWTDEDDRIMEEIYIDRKRDTRAEISR